jgi:lysozyme
VNDHLVYDHDGLDLTEDAEGLRLTAYPDPGTGGHPWTIGYGHTGADVFQGLTISQELAEKLLRQDVHDAESAIHQLVTTELTQHQFDALVDFAFNCGAHNLATSTLLRHVNAGEFEAATKEFARWVNGGGHVLPGLVKRRHAEAALFAS